VPAPESLFSAIRRRPRSPTQSRFNNGVFGLQVTAWAIIGRVNPTLLSKGVMD
jgi:hypothetical protein